MKSFSPIEITKPSAQLKLFGFENYFNFFDKLYNSKKLPNSILLSGPKGIGKSTFAYHLANYLLSKNEKFKYDNNKFLIDKNNQTYKLIQDEIHANLFILDSINNNENIKIEQIRKLLHFLNKSTYYKELKIVIIDNAESLNINSSNALLKAVEEPLENTFFLIIHNSSQKLIKTIKSRCVDFKFNLNLPQKKEIFKEISKSYNFNFTEDDLNNFLRFDTHGNLLNYLAMLEETDFNLSDNYSSCITHFMDLYASQNDFKILNYLSIFIQNFYNQLSLKNGLLISTYQKNLNEILYMINNTKRFNLDKKNLIFTINKIITNER